MVRRSVLFIQTLFILKEKDLNLPEVRNGKQTHPIQKFINKQGRLVNLSQISVATGFNHQGHLVKRQHLSVYNKNAKKADG